MALLGASGFDHTANVAHYFDSVVGGVSIEAVGRFGTNGFRAPSGGDTYGQLNTDVAYTLIASNCPFSHPQGTMGFAVYIPTPTAIGLESRLVRFSRFLIRCVADGDTQDDQAVLELWLSSNDGRFYAKMNGGGVSGYSTGIFRFGQYHYIELQPVIAISQVANTCSGSIAIWIDGVSAGTVSAGSVATGSTSTFGTSLTLGNGGSLGPIDYDDLYLDDNNTRLGDFHINTLFPTGAGSFTQWTPSAGSNYQNVDETSPNDDTDYNSETTIGEQDLYACSDLPVSTVGVIGVIVRGRAKRTVVGTAALRLLAKSGVTTGESVDVVLLTSYAYVGVLFNNNPDTAAPWTFAEVNGAEFGVKLQSGSSPDVRITQLVIEVLTADPNIRMTQAVSEVLETGAIFRVTQAVVESLETGATLRVTQASVESIETGAIFRMTQAPVEVIRDNIQYRVAMLILSRL